jgi:hypothetical protein
MLGLQPGHLGLAVCDLALDPLGIDVRCGAVVTTGGSDLVRLPQTRREAS